MVTHRYALNKNKKIILIDNINDENINDLFSCPGCKKELRPRATKSYKKSPHFYHPNHMSTTQEKCSEETYLHRISKELLAESFRKSKPFILKRELTSSCTNKDADWGLCHKEFVRSTDLTIKYPLVSVETRDGDFIPDILLQNKSGEKLYIEICNTSACSKKKIDSGNKIIEIKVESEKSIEAIINLRTIDSSYVSVKLINFENIDKTFDCGGECKFVSSHQPRKLIRTLTLDPNKSLIYDGFVSNDIKEIIMDLKHIEKGKLTEKAQKILSKMIPFYNDMYDRVQSDLENDQSEDFPKYKEMIRSISMDHQDLESYKTLYSVKDFQFTRYRGDYFCIVNIGLYYLAYQVEEYKIIPMLKSNSSYKLSLLLKEHTDRKIEDLF